MTKKSTGWYNYRATLKEQSEMRKMGYTIRAWYKNAHGVPFHKDFRTIEEFWDFGTKVHEAKGVTLCHHMIVSSEEYKNLTMTEQEKAELESIELPFK